MINIRKKKTLDDVLRESLSFYIERHDVMSFIEAIKAAYFEGYRNGCIDMA